MNKSTEADNLIQERLREMAGEGDIISRPGQKDEKGMGKGKYVDLEGDPESKKRNSDKASFSNFNSADKDNEREDIVNTIIEEEGEGIIKGDSVDIEPRNTEEDTQDEQEVNKVAFADRVNTESSISDGKDNIIKRMEKVGLSKDEAIDMILQLTDEGYIVKKEQFFNGKISMELKSPTLLDTSDFVDEMDKEEINTPSKVEFFINLYSFASVLTRYNKTSLSDMTVTDRAEWIKKNIPSVLYKIILPRVFDFHEKLELLSSQEVSDFF